MANPRPLPQRTRLLQYLGLFFAWLTLCSGLGFLVAVSAAGRGGASAIFVTLGAFVGLAGGGIHSLLLSIRSQHRWDSLWIVGSICSILGVIYFMNEQGVKNGYQLENTRMDYTYLRKNDVMVVKPTIVDLDVWDDLIIGIRVPSRRLSCDAGARSTIRVGSDIEYFVLDTHTGLIQSFNNQAHALRHIRDMKIESDVFLNSMKAEKLIQKYSRDQGDEDDSDCIDTTVPWPDHDE